MRHNFLPSLNKKSHKKLYYNNLNPKINYFLFFNSEIINSIDKTRTAYKTWLEYKVQSSKEDKDLKNEFDEKTLELRNQIRSLEWDIEGKIVSFF